MTGDAARAVAAVLARPIAHRGLHVADGPVENTLGAAEAAARAGYGVECDVRLSRDGQAVVFHDERLVRLAGRDAALADLDAAELGAVHLADGTSIPTLAALLHLLDGRAPLVIEIKSVDPATDEALCDAVLAAVQGYAGALAIESFAPAAVRRCAAAACPVGLVGPAAAFDSLAAIPALPRCEFLSWSVARLGEAAARRPELPLSTWTVRRPAERAIAKRAGAQIVFEGFRP